MSMTPRQRVINALRGDAVDMAPVANPNSIVTRELQERANAFFPEAHHNGEIMAELALAGHTICGYDNVFPVFGAGTQEAGAMGIDIDWGDPDNLPAILGHIWDHPDQIHVPDDFLERAEIKAVLDSIRILRQELGDRVAIFGKAYGPWSLAYHFFGIQEFLMDTLRDPGKVHAILERLSEFTVVFGKAQIEAGADALNVCEHITADLVRPEAYERYLLKVDHAITEQLPVPIILHCCGKTMDRIHLFNQGGFACFNFESANDAREMRAKAEITLCGNINNPRTILSGTPEDVEREVFYALDAGVDILAPECAAPVNGKLANVTAVREARDRYYEQGGTRRERKTTVQMPTAKPIRSASASGRAGPSGLSEPLRAIYQAVLEMETGRVADMVREEIDRKTPVQTILDDALIAAMEEVGERFAEGVYFVPEMLMAAKEMQSGLEVIRPILTQTGVPPRGKVLLGTVKGDVHDIGKNLYGMMMEGAGYTVVDIGVRNTADDFIEAILEHSPDIVGMSAMLTTTMPYMKVVIEEMAKRGMRDDYIVLVGGAPLNEEFGERVGADAYCADAGIGVETANRLLAGRRKSPDAGVSLQAAQ